MGVLDDMTKGITERKAAKAGKSLTPVGREASPVKPSALPIPDVPEVFLTNEAVADIARDLRVQAATLIGVADGLDKLTTKSTVPAEVVIVDEKEAEREADRKAAERDAAKPPKKAKGETKEDFDERLARLAAEAQAAVFTTPEPTDGWVCPEHGDKALEHLESRLRPSGYLACTEAGCGEFER